MSQTVTVSDALYQRLTTEAERRGLNGVEDLLELWILGEQNNNQRRDTVRDIRAFRERMQTKYGETTDSVALLRADRMR
jgi:hypothetical protein